MATTETRSSTFSEFRNVWLRN